MTITRYDSTTLLSQAVTHGDTVHLCGVVSKDLTKDIKGQTTDVLNEIDRLLAKCGSNKSKILTAMMHGAELMRKA